MLGSEITVLYIQARLMCQKKMVGVPSKACMTLVRTDRDQLNLNTGNYLSFYLTPLGFRTAIMWLQALKIPMFENGEEVIPMFAMYMIT